MEVRVIGQVKDGATAEVLGLQGGDIVFDADNICYLWHKSDAPEGLYTFPQPIGTGNTTATYLGPANDIADDYAVSGMAIRGRGMEDYPLVISDKRNDMIHEVSVGTGDMGDSYPMYLGGSPFNHINGDMTIGKLGEDMEPGPVGGEASSVSRVNLVMPWLILASLLAGGVAFEIWKRRRAES